MGIMSNIAAQVTGASPVELAKAGVAKAEEAVAAVAKRIAAAEEEVREATDAIAAIDPDVPDAALEKLARRRDAVSARLGALRGRATAAAEELKAARDALASAERDAKRAELARLGDDLVARSNLLTQETLAFEAQLAVKMGQLMEVAQRALDLVEELRSAGETVDFTGTAWVYACTQ